MSRKRRGLCIALFLSAAVIGAPFYLFHMVGASPDSRNDSNGSAVLSGHCSCYEADEQRFPDIDWGQWKKRNEALIGWVTVEGTLIDGPIVQAPNDAPAFYLDHDFDRREDGEGCAFLDAECSEMGLLSKNSAIFGHHLKEGRGFSAFARYSNNAFAEDHKEILLQTPEWRKALKVVFVEVTQGQSPTKVTWFENDDQFRLWTRARYKASCVRLIDDLNDLSCERIWTFCTCSYTTYEDERTLVYAIEQ